MEKNLAIYNEMRAAAERVFNEGINAPVGSYTLSDLANIEPPQKASKDICFRDDYNANELININIDGFVCSFAASHVFYLARRFEVFAKVSKRNCAIFTRKTENGAPVAVFTLDAATCNSLAACEDPRKTLRVQMACVFIDLAAGLAVCSDGYVMNVTKIENARVMKADALKYGGVLIPRDFAKSAKGRDITIYQDGNDLIASADNGAACKCIEGRYPNYKDVLLYADKKAVAPVSLIKSMWELKKKAAAIAKTAGKDVVYISGINGDDFITLSASGGNDEITLPVRLSSRLAFNFTTALKVANIKSINNNADTLYISYFGTIIFGGAKVVGVVSPAYDSDEATAAAAAAEKIATKLKDLCNVCKDFISSAVPAESIQTEDSDNAEHVAPVEDVTEDSDNAKHVAPRRVWLDCLKVAAVLLLAFVLRSVSTSDSNAAPSLKSRAAVVDVEPLQAVEILDTLDVAPVAPSDSIQTTEGTDTLDAAPVAPAQNLYIIGHSKN